MKPITFQKTRHVATLRRRSLTGSTSLLSVLGALAILLLVTAGICAAMTRKVMG